VAAVVAALALAVGAVAASRSVPPLVVESASLTRTGPDLVWAVRTRTGFSPNELGRDNRTLCVLLERPARGGQIAVFAEVCVRHPGSRIDPQLYYRPVTAAGEGVGGPLTATVTRADDSQLTATFAAADVGADQNRPLRFQILSAAIGPSCTIAMLGRLQCGTRYPAVPASAATAPAIPTGCAATGPSYVTGGPPGGGNVVALTFDDGPWYDTPRFLDVLEREHVVATFFQIGRQLDTYGGAVDKRMLADGDVIGDHTWNHPIVAGAGLFAQTEIERTANAIRALTGFTPCLFRAPYGATGPALIRLARSLGFTTIQWNVDPADWTRPGAATIAQRVIGAVRPGSIVIQHDGGGDRSETVAALPHEVEALRARGYTFVTVPQLLGLRMLH
jgi:peptidoglycan/xylan/chitin deacetylase (PgdA/CDA1 family)